MSVVAEETSASRYVKLDKEHELPSEEIRPGELNQPVYVPQVGFVAWDLVGFVAWDCGGWALRGWIRASERGLDVGLLRIGLWSSNTSLVGSE